jgi:pyruvate dehydrogenase E1 component alpha subunit
MEAGLTSTDAIITAYRVHGNAYGRGESIQAIIAEMMGRGSGSSKGKGGSMHYYNSAARFYGGNGIVGAQVPVGAGVAFAMKYKGENNVTVAMFGDGAANQGQVNEAINMAHIWKLPAIFMIENNHYGMGTPAERASSNIKFYTRHPPVPGFELDGMNVFAVREAMKFAK